MHSVANFPEFSKLDIKHKDELREIAEQFPSYSDFNFVSLFTWDVDGEVEISDLNGNLVMKFTDYNDGSAFLTFLGTNQLLHTIEQLLDYCKDNNLPEELKLIGEAIVHAIPKEEKHKYLIKEDRDNHDYILSAANMSDIGNFHPKKRTKYNYFMREYGEKHQLTELDLDDPDTLQDIRQMLIDWQGVRGKESAEIKREFTAIEKCLEHSKVLNILGYGTYVDDKLIAFTLFELIHEKTAMLHFGKTNISFKGSNEHLQHNLAKYLNSLDVELMNNEQDMGIEGLRKSKESSLPIYFLKKYTVGRAQKILD